MRRPESSAPRLNPLWLGASVAGWTRLLARNGFRVDARYLPTVARITASALRNSVLRTIQERVWGERVRGTAIDSPPLFVIGHWRSGTTWLHELLALDPQHTFPTTYACLSPNHFLLTEPYLTGRLRFVLPALPERRPMDDMVMGWDRPNEDEFALCNLGLPSPYLTNAFPNHPPQDAEYEDLERVSPHALARWKAGFLQYLKQLTLRDPRRIVLKSPTHTSRIKVLLALFPDAQFVHIVRNPYQVFPSTVKLLKAMYTNFGLQRPTFRGLEDYVVSRFLRLHARLDDTRGLVKPGQFHELRYEDLVRDPIREVRTIYEHLGLGDFDEVLPRLRHYLHEVRGHRTGRYALPPATRERLATQWGPVIRRYGYLDEEDAP
jgi:omega-hydroxy-beta-dihydromenaquinone-9 sulfotransferase